MALLSTTFEHINTSIVNVTEDAEESNNMFHDGEYSLWMKAVYVLSWTVSLVAIGTAILVLHRTKKMPHNTQFLTFWLLVFEGLYIVVTCVRNFIVDPMINSNIYIFSSMMLQWSYLTICIMAVERLVLFQWPYFYVRYCRKAALRKIALAVWFISCFMFYMILYCYLQYMPTLTFVKGYCYDSMIIYAVFFNVIVLGVSTVCYCNIFRIVQMKTMDNQGGIALSVRQTARELRGYRTTSAVLLFLLTIYLTVVSLLTIVILRYVDVLSVSVTRLFVEIVAIWNCLLDPYLYVMWFRESRMELLKLFCSWNIHFRKKAELMRIDIFCIVTNENRTTQ